MRLIMPKPRNPVFTHHWTILGEGNPRNKQFWVPLAHWQPDCVAVSAKPCLTATSQSPVTSQTSCVAFCVTVTSLVVMVTSHATVWEHLKPFSVLSASGDTGSLPRLQHLSYFEPVNLGQDGKMFTEEAELHVRPNLCTEMLLSYILSHSMNDS